MVLQLRKEIGPCRDLADAVDRSDRRCQARSAYAVRLRHPRTGRSRTLRLSHIAKPAPAPPAQSRNGLSCSSSQLRRPAGTLSLPAVYRLRADTRSVLPWRSPWRRRWYSPTRQATRRQVGGETDVAPRRSSSRSYSIRFPITDAAIESQPHFTGLHGESKFGTVARCTVHRYRTWSHCLSPRM